MRLFSAVVGLALLSLVSADSSWCTQPANLCGWQDRDGDNCNLYNDDTIIDDPADPFNERPIWQSFCSAEIAPSYPDPDGIDGTEACCACIGNLGGENALDSDIYLPKSCPNFNGGNCGFTFSTSWSATGGRLVAPNRNSGDSTVDAAYLRARYCSLGKNTIKLTYRATGAGITVAWGFQGPVAAAAATRTWTTIGTYPATAGADSVVYLTFDPPARENGRPGDVSRTARNFFIRIQSVTTGTPTRTLSISQFQIRPANNCAQPTYANANQVTQSCPTAELSTCRILCNNGYSRTTVPQCIDGQWTNAACELCVDRPYWNDTAGHDTCAEYKANEVTKGWCDTGSGYFDISGVSANDGCCACGGGYRPTLPAVKSLSCDFSASYCDWVASGGLPSTFSGSGLQLADGAAGVLTSFSWRNDERYPQALAFEFDGAGAAWSLSVDWFNGGTNKWEKYRTFSNVQTSINLADFIGREITFRLTIAVTKAGTLKITNRAPGTTCGPVPQTVKRTSPCTTGTFAEFATCSVSCTRGSFDDGLGQVVCRNGLWEGSNCEDCSNYAGWKDQGGDSCDAWTRGGQAWCRSADSYQDLNGIGPQVACCVCGGGLQEGQDPTPQLGLSGAQLDGFAFDTIDNTRRSLRTNLKTFTWNSVNGDGATGAGSYTFTRDASDLVAWIAVDHTVDVVVRSVTFTAVVSTPVTVTISSGSIPSFSNKNVVSCGTQSLTGTDTYTVNCPAVLAPSGRYTVISFDAATTVTATISNLKTDALNIEYSLTQPGGGSLTTVSARIGTQFEVLDVDASTDSGSPLSLTLSYTQRDFQGDTGFLVTKSWDLTAANLASGFDLRPFVGLHATVSISGQAPSKIRSLTVNAAQNCPAPIKAGLDLTGCSTHEFDVCNLPCPTGQSQTSSFSCLGGEWVGIDASRCTQCTDECGWVGPASFPTCASFTYETCLSNGATALDSQGLSANDACCICGGGFRPEFETKPDPTCAWGNACSFTSQGDWTFANGKATIASSTKTLTSPWFRVCDGATSVIDFGYSATGMTANGAKLYLETALGPDFNNWGQPVLTLGDSADSTQVYNLRGSAGKTVKFRFRADGAPGFTANIGALTVRGQQDCARPNVPHNRTLCTNGNVEGGVCGYSCLTDFERPAEDSKCVRGAYSPATPKCTVVGGGGGGGTGTVCAANPTITNGEPIGNCEGTPACPNCFCQYQCDDGYLTADATATGFVACTAEDTWANAMCFPTAEGSATQLSGASDTLNIDIDETFPAFLNSPCPGNGRGPEKIFYTAVNPGETVRFTVAHNSGGRRALSPKFNAITVGSLGVSSQSGAAGAVDLTFVDRPCAANVAAIWTNTGASTMYAFYIVDTATAAGDSVTVKFDIKGCPTGQAACSNNLADSSCVSLQSDYNCGQCKSECDSNKGKSCAANGVCNVDRCTALFPTTGIDLLDFGSCAGQEVCAPSGIANPAPGEAFACFPLGGVCTQGGEPCPAGHYCAPEGCRAYQAVCGNLRCEYGEDDLTCPRDCPPAGPFCGDTVCTGFETADNCPQDCSGAWCGNNKCDVWESRLSCAVDCGAPVNPGRCGDKVCDAPETPATCPGDCGTHVPTDCLDASLNNYTTSGWVTTTTGPRYCEQGIEDGGWQLVAFQAPGQDWAGVDFTKTDRSASFGTYNAPGAGANTGNYAAPWPQDAVSVLLITQDKSKYVALRLSDLSVDTVTGSTVATVLASRNCLRQRGEETTVFAGGKLLVGCDGTVWDNAGNALWSQRQGLFTNVKSAHGGIAVYVRPNTAPYVDQGVPSLIIKTGIPFVFPIPNDAFGDFESDDVVRAGNVLPGKLAVKPVLSPPKPGKGKAGPGKGKGPEEPEWNGKGGSGPPTPAPTGAPTVAANTFGLSINKTYHGSEEASIVGLVPNGIIGYTTLQLEVVDAHGVEAWYTFNVYVGCDPKCKGPSPGKNNAGTAWACAFPQCKACDICAPVRTPLPCWSDSMCTDKGDRCVWMDTVGYCASTLTAQEDIWGNTASTPASARNAVTWYSFTGGLVGGGFVVAIVGGVIMRRFKKKPEQQSQQGIEAVIAL